MGRPEKFRWITLLVYVRASLWWKVYWYKWKLNWGEKSVEGWFFLFFFLFVCFVSFCFVFFPFFFFLLPRYGKNAKPSGAFCLNIKCVAKLLHVEPWVQISLRLALLPYVLEQQSSLLLFILGNKTSTSEDSSTKLSPSNKDLPWVACIMSKLGSLHPVFIRFTIYLIFICKPVPLRRVLILRTDPV